MTRLPCSGDWLVEYADGDLSGQQFATAESHLAACPQCSRELAALKRSRAMLSTYWEALPGKQAPAVFKRVPRTTSLPPWQTAAMALVATAAALFVVVTLAFDAGQRSHISNTEPAAPAVAQIHPKKNAPNAESPASSSDDGDDILAQISRETQIARLRAVSEILATEPGMMERHLALEKYLADAYGVTAAGSKSEM